MKKHYIIVPVFNEQKNIKIFLVKLKKYSDNIIVVNDGSTDHTKKILEKISGIRLINLKKNNGKGMAMKKGAQIAWRLKATAIVFMDGDNQHEPKYLPKFYNLLEKGEDIVIGIRVIKANIPLIRRWGNTFGQFLMELFFKVRINDLLCGFRALSYRGYKKVIWTSKDYGVETEMLTLIGRKKIPYKTLVVDTIYLDKYKGFSIIDGIKILFRFPYWRFRKL